MNFAQAVGWVVGFVMGDFKITLMWWTAGMVLSIIVSLSTNLALPVAAVHRPFVAYFADFCTDLDRSTD